MFADGKWVSSQADLCWLKPEMERALSVGEYSALGDFQGIDEPAKLSLG